MEKLKVFLAPLQGLSEVAFRNALDKHFGGVDAYFTPFIRWEHGGVRKRDLRGIAPEANHVGRLVPQILASTVEEAELLLQPVADMGYREVDLNLGCAFPMLAKKGKGCGMLPYPDRVGNLLQIAERHHEISFSVKMRLGHVDATECLNLLPIINQASLAHVTVHARVGRQQYDGECNRDAFNAFASQCAHPVVYNGDVRTAEDIEALQSAIPYLHGVMVGRGLLARPWLAAEYKAGNAWDADSRASRLRALHADMLDYYTRTLEGGEKQLLDKMKPFWEYFCPDGDRKLHKRIHKAQKLTDYTQAAEQLLVGENE